MELLNKQQQALLAEERSLLNDLRVALVKFGATDEDQETLEKSIAQLDDFFLLVIVGEFNAGKSAGGVVGIPRSGPYRAAPSDRRLPAAWRPYRTEGRYRTVCPVRLHRW